MSAANRVRALTRWGAVGVMATAVLTATGGGFAQSYAGLYHWALEHGLSGWKAQSFPLLVDLFIIVGELGLFLLALDAFVLHRRNMMSWMDFFLPLFIALAGWTASLVFNVGHVVQRDFSYQATAAVPPIVSMLGLFVLLRTLHRYVQDQDGRAVEGNEAPGGEGERRAISPMSLHRMTLVPMQVMPQLPAGPTTASAAWTASATPARSAGPTAPPVAGATGTVEPAPPAEGGTGLPVTGQNGLNGQGLNGQGLNGQGLNGHGGGAGDEVPAVVQATTGRSGEAAQSTTATIDGIPVIDAATDPAPDPEMLRNQILSALGRSNGDVVAAQADLMAGGRYCGQDEIGRVREQHWFPYALYRLMAKHAGDSDLVAAELAERGVEYDRATFDALVRAWRA